MKKNRDELKDKNDCRMMEAFMEKDEFKMIVSKFKQKIYYETLAYQLLKYLI